ARHASRHYVLRLGKRHTRRRWPKLSIVLDTHTHLILSAVVSRGPGSDAGQVRPAPSSAAAGRRVGTPVGDAGDDAAPHHASGRRKLGIRSTVISVYRRGGGRGPVRGKYRRQMQRRFRPKPKKSRYKRVYGQRWQVESGISRHKRRLGSAMRAK